ncbi:MAG: cation transporter [Candidatus Zixiibacteriota bacterium]
MRKAIFFGFAIMLGLIMVGAQSNVMACDGNKSGAKMGSTSNVDATMAGANMVGSKQCAAGTGEVKMTAKNNSEAGNLVKFATAEFSVKGMTCAGCENQVKTALMKYEGVNEVAEVSHVKEHATVKYDPAKVNPTELATAITSLGYKSEYMKVSTDMAKESADKKVEEVKNKEM